MLLIWHQEGLQPAKFLLQQSEKLHRKTSVNLASSEPLAAAGNSRQTWVSVSFNDYQIAQKCSQKEIYSRNDTKEIATIWTLSVLVLWMEIGNNKVKITPRLVQSLPTRDAEPSVYNDDDDDVLLTVG